MGGLGVLGFLVFGFWGFSFFGVFGFLGFGVFGFRFFGVWGFLGFGVFAGFGGPLKSISNVSLAGVSWHRVQQQIAHLEI